MDKPEQKTDFFNFNNYGYSKNTDKVRYSGMFLP